MYFTPLFPHIFRPNNFNIFSILPFIYNKIRHMRHLSEKYCYQIGASSYCFRNEARTFLSQYSHPQHTEETQKLIFLYPQFRYVPYSVQLSLSSYNNRTLFVIFCAKHIIAKRPRMTMTISLYGLTFSRKPLYKYDRCQIHLIINRKV